MNNQEKIKQRVEKTIGSIDGLENLEAGSDFFTGIQRKIYEQEKTGVSRSFSLFKNLKLQPVLMSAILMVNIFSTLFFILGSDKGTQADDQYQEYASMLLEANTIESNTLGENIATNFTGEVE